MARDEHGKLLVNKFAGTADPAANAALGTFPFSEGWDENYWPPGTGTISGPVVNAILRIISAVGVEVNLNGILEWDTSISYKDDAIVRGSDGALYQAQQAIDMPSDRLVDPTMDDDGSHWKLITERYLADQAAAQAGTDAVKLMTPALVRAAVNALIATVAQAQDANNNANLMTPQRVRNLITHILATAAQARAGRDVDVLMTPLRVRDAMTALLATTAQAQAGSDPSRLMTPVRVREAITYLIASQAEAEAGAVNNKLMTPVRVREAITYLIASQAEAEAGAVNNRLMTPARVQNFIDRNPPTVRRHDSPAITLDAATGAVVDTSSTLGSGVAKEFQPLLVAARARGGYSLGAEVTPLGNTVDVQVRKVNDTSFAVHAASGEIRMPILGDPNGLYMFTHLIGGRVYRRSLPVPTAGFAAGSAVGTTPLAGRISPSGATYWPVAGEESVLMVDIYERIYSFTNPLIASELGRIAGVVPHGNGGNVTGLAAHEVSGDMRLYSVTSYGRLVHINPENAGDGSGDYGVIAGNLPRGSGEEYEGLASHKGTLYGLRVSASVARLVVIDVSNPASSRVLTGNLLRGRVRNASLFSDGTSLYYFSDRNLYRLTTLTSSAAAASLVGTVTGIAASITGACVVTNFPSTQRMRLGNTGDSNADWNLKIRYTA